MAHKGFGVRQTERRSVYILDVDVPNRTAHTQDKTGGRVIVGFRYMAGANQIPKQHEWWIIERNTSHEWHLVHRLDSNAEHTDLLTYSPGDTRLRAPGALRIRAQAIDVASDASVSGPKPLGATRWEKTTTVGATTSWTLTEAPVHIQTVQLHNNGSLVDPTTLTLTGKVLSFSSIAAGHTLIVYYQTV